MDALGLAMSAMLLIAKIAKARKADRDLSMVISILPMSDVIKLGSTSCRVWDSTTNKHASAVWRTADGPIAEGEGARCDRFSAMRD